MAFMDALVKVFWEALKATIGFHLGEKETRDPQVVTESAKKHMYHLSNQIAIVEEINNMAYLKDGRIPRRPTQWVKEATVLIFQACDAFNQQQNSEELNDMCKRIFDCLKHCPVDIHDKPMAFIAWMHETEARNLSHSSLLQSEDELLQAQDVEKEVSYSSDMSMLTSDCREGDGIIITLNDAPTLTSESENLMVGETADEGESSRVHELGTSIRIPVRPGKLEIIEEGAATQGIVEPEKASPRRRREKMPIGVSDPNDVWQNELRVLKSENNQSDLPIKMCKGECAALPSQTDQSEVGTTIRVSVNGVVLGLEILTSSSSQETDNLNSYFGLDPKKENYLFSAAEHEYLIVNRSGSGSKEMPTSHEWSQAVVVNLMERNELSLHEKTVCPNLVLLFLQRNNRLTHIPDSFFKQMPALSFLDLSNTRVKELPTSLFTLTNLLVLLLRSCVRLKSLPADLKNLKKMEVLDVLETDLYSIPKEIGELTQLRHLHLSFYGPDYGSGYAHLPAELISPGVISQLQALQALSIVVHPEDQRWKKIVSDVIIHVGRLEMLSYLQFYFPTVEDLKSFIEESPPWKQQTLRRFKFIVGRNIKRIISRVPDEVESEFNQHDRCLRFVNGSGSDVPQVMKSVLKPVTAFYLDHHLEVQSLSEFGIPNFKQLRFCVVRECPTMKVVIIGEERSISVFPNLEYLGLHYLWDLERIWEDPVPAGSFRRLKFLMVGTCPKLENITSHSILQCLSNLETFTIEDCENLKSIVSENETVKYDDAPLLPRLTKLVLRHLPRMVTLGNDLFPSEATHITIHYCPQLILRPGLGRRKFLCSLYDCCNICLTSEKLLKR